MTRPHRALERGTRRSVVMRAVLSSIAGAAIVVALTVATEGCGRNASAETTPATPVVTLVTDDIATVERRDLASGPIVSGTLTARRRATVRAEVGGSVTAVYADRGTVVAAGAPLLRIEGRAILDAQVAAASDVRTEEDALAIVRRRLTRSETLLAGGAISADEVDDARQALTSAEARLATSRARLTAATDALSRTLVRAPFAGIVSARPVNAGDIIESGNVLFEVIDPATMYVEGSVPAAEIGSVHVGAPVELTVTGYPDRTFAGHVERVSPSADPTTRQVPVFIAIGNGDGRLVAGLFAEGRVAPSTAGAMLVPDAAIDRTADSTSVIRFANGRLERRVVKTGRRDRDGALVEILSGVTLGDTIVLGVSRALPSGTTARVAGAKPSLTATNR